MSEAELLLLVQVVVSGLLAGAVYGLSACGLNLIVGVMGIVNMAHGEQLMIGAFVTFGVFTLLGTKSPLILLVAIPVTFVFGMAIQKYLLERMMASLEVGTLLLTFGLSVFLSTGFIFLFTANYRSVHIFGGSLLLGQLAFPIARVTTAAIALAITVAIYLFLKRHRLGKAIRATSQNADAARSCGIDVRRIRILSFGLGSAMAGAAGAMVSTSYAFNPDIGQTFMLKTFAAITLGGMGSFVGGLIGALLLGLAESLAAWFMTAQIAEMVAYVVLVAVLLVQPTGLMGLRRR
jgi:branched-chain amino acid transport system permease protein